MRRWSIWPNSLFGRHLLLIVGLILVAEIVLALGYHGWVQRPRVERMVRQLDAQLYVQAQALSLLDAAGQQRFATRMSEKPNVLWLSHRPPDQAQVPDTLLLRLAQQRVHEHVGQQVLFQSAAQTGPRLWWQAELAGQTWWVGLDVRPLLAERGQLWLAVLGLTALLAVLGAALIQRHLHHPLLALQRAARQVAQGRYQSVQLPAGSPAELCELGQAFDHMALQLQSAEQERALMLAGLSHDLRTPLAKLRLAAEILQVDGEEELLKSMVRNIDAADQIITQFIDFARAGVPEDDVASDLDELVNDVVCRQANDRLYTAGPSQPVGLLVCKPLALQRGLTNLIDNALKYSDGKVSVSWGIEGASVFIGVQDQGPGIPEDVLPRVTQPFVRRDFARGGPPGSGLGLAIVERMAQQMGGALVLRQEHGLHAEIRWPCPPR